MLVPADQFGHRVENVAPVLFRNPRSGVRHEKLPNPARRTSRYLDLVGIAGAVAQGV